MLRSDAARVIGSDIGWHVRTLARCVANLLDRRLAPSGLTSAQFTAMCLVASAPDDTIGALANQARLDQSTLSRNLDGLARAGLIEIVMSEADRRRRAVWLTEAGARALAEAMPLWQQAHEELEQALDAGIAAALKKGVEVFETSAR